ncbi:hypothetical protein F0562_005899 [Nyssa sinensis]|uniref:Agenet domain-containing protein n=1 Tax=Nyssa sinensis TaxID=561372 RepID=A0A5J5AP62_9ASTE|nr:hypothetical protein F0562_005899 [Nyssa sinensis]
MPERHFNKGDKVEVTRDDDRSNGFWLPATVLRSSPAKHKDKIYVAFETVTSDNNKTKRLREYVNVANVRPTPPLELHRYFKVGDHIDAYHKNGWRKGTVVDILENSRYLVAINGGSEENEVEQRSLRAHRDWNDGSWVPPLEQQNKPSELEMKSRVVKVRIKYSGRASGAKFSKGTMVEVKSDEEGYRGSWYTARIVGSVGNDMFLVEYLTLKTDDETEPLREKADASCIRPCPPEIPRVDSFEQLEEVDAWYNDGWWVGHISKVLDGLKCDMIISAQVFASMYLIYAIYKLQTIHLPRRSPNFDFPQRRSSEVKLKSREVKFKIKYSGRTSEAKFNKGTMVEVKSDEEGYQGSWYTAVIVGSIGNKKFLVEYQTLKTGDESRPLREQTDASCFRPCPPETHRADRFKLLEEVDAWYNDGWWVGLISKVFDGLNYAVYFWNTNEKLEFEHFNLRPHQEWIDGKWVVSFRRGWSELPFKSRLGKLKINFHGKTTEAMFSNGTKVEVKSDEEDYRGFWYPAVIISPTGNGKYLVEFLTLKTDDEIELLTVEADALCIRPCPPVVQRVDRYKPLEEVDAWYNYGWWVGQVYKAEGSKHEVYLKTTNEVLEFQHSNLRPHQDWNWIDGKWVIAAKGWNL